MDAQFSEIQLAYSITREIEDRVVFSNLKMGIPVMSNRREEAEGDYDTTYQGKLAAVFLQYKLPEYMIRSNAKEWEEMGKKEYYRVQIYPNDQSPQHNYLCSLAQKDARNKVYYCAPAFVKYSDYELLHRIFNVAEHSVFVDCNHLPKISGNERHNICYQISPKRMVMHSETRTLEIMQGWHSVLYDEEAYYENIGEFISNMWQREEQFGSPFWAESEKEILRSIGLGLAERGIHLLLVRV